MSQPSGARILVVDDEPGILRAVQTNLGRHDFRVDTASTATAGLECYARVRPDLVLLDLAAAQQPINVFSKPPADASRLRAWPILYIQCKLSSSTPPPATAFLSTAICGVAPAPAGRPRLTW